MTSFSYSNKQRKMAVGDLVGAGVGVAKEREVAHEAAQGEGVTVGVTVVTW
jgi:hypothetical protein